MEIYNVCVCPKSIRLDCKESSWSCFTRRSSWNRNWKLVPSGWSCCQGVIQKLQVNELKIIVQIWTVIEVDEYRTSQVCSKCKDGKKHKDDHKLDKANLIVKKKVRNDQGEFVTQRELGSCYTFWQRDVNACRNIYGSVYLSSLWIAKTEVSWAWNNIGKGVDIRCKPWRG